MTHYLNVISNGHACELLARYGCNDVSVPYSSSKVSKSFII